MATAQEYMQQLETMGGSAPDFRQDITKMYDQPVLRPLVNEAANLESEYLNSIFEPFTKMGTGAADLSPAAKLAAIGQSVGRLGGRVSANRSIQDFYGTQIQDLANLENQKWMQRRQSLMDLYNMAFQQEEAAMAQQINWDDILNSMSGGGGAVPDARAQRTSDAYQKGLAMYQDYLANRPTGASAIAQGINNLIRPGAEAGLDPVRGGTSQLFRGMGFAGGAVKNYNVR